MDAVSSLVLMGAIWAVMHYLFVAVLALFSVYFAAYLILRTRGYTLLPGFFCLHFRAPPGSRRYPNGVVVTLATLFVSFLRSGFRGPFISLTCSSFHMRLSGMTFRTYRRPSAPRRRRRNYPFIVLRNMVYRVLALLIRCLKITVGELLISRADGTLQVEAHDFVFSGHAAGILGYRYALSMDSFVARLVQEPLQRAPVGIEALEFNVELNRKTNLDFIYLPRLITLLRPRRMAFMDDLKVKIKLIHLLLTSPSLLNITVSSLSMTLYPGYSRALRRKLPPSAPRARRTRVPGIIRYWDSSGSMEGVSLCLAVSKLKNACKERAFFVRAQEIRWEGCGSVGDHRYEPITNLTIFLTEISSGANAVSTFDGTVFENFVSSYAKEDTEAHEFIKKVVAASPACATWVSRARFTLNSNFQRRDVSIVGLEAANFIAAVEPCGLSRVIIAIRVLFSNYFGSSSCERRTYPNSPLRSSESTSSIASLSELQSPGVEASVRFKESLFLILNDGPTGRGDTLALTLSAREHELSRLFRCGNVLELESRHSDFKVMHVSESGWFENLTCRELICRIGCNSRAERAVEVQDVSITWDADFHAAFCTLADVLKYLRAARPWSLAMPSSSSFDRGRDPSFLSQVTLSGKNVTLCVRFPDGPCASIMVGSFLRLSLSDDSCSCHDIVWFLQDTPILYIADFRLENPITSLKAPQAWLRMTTEGVRGILREDFWFGSLLQDWLLRIKTTVKFIRSGQTADLSSEVAEEPESVILKEIFSHFSEKRPFPDLYINATDVEFFFEDNKLCGWMTRVLPLMQDENREKFVRRELLEKKLVYMSAKHTRAYHDELRSRMDEVDARLYIERVRRLKAQSRKFEIAPGFIEGLEEAPLAVVTFAEINLKMVRNDSMVKNGVKESLRLLQELDEFTEDGTMRHREAWAEIGFRVVSASAKGLRLKFRDYPTAFISLDTLNMENGLFGIATQAAVAPFITEAEVALGNRTVVRIKKGLGSSKFFVDAALFVGTLQGCYNTAFLPVLTDFGRACGRFAPESKNPSPRMAWFDNLRYNSHGRVQVTANTVSGRIAGSNSPYTLTKHFVDVHAENVQFIASRLSHSFGDMYPLSWELKNFYIWPTVFRRRAQSEIFFEEVKVGLNPVPRTRGDNPLNHYVIPFATSDDYKRSLPGAAGTLYTIIRVPKAVKTRRFSRRTFTSWRSLLADVPQHDSYKLYRTFSMTLGVDIFVKHCLVPNPAERKGSDRMTPYCCGKPRSRLKGRLNPASMVEWAPEGSSLAYSDGITTLTKVIKMLARKTVFCRPPPRFRDRTRKDPPTYGLGTVVNKSVIQVKAKNLAVMVYNNLEPGCGLFASIRRGSLNIVKERPFQPVDLQNIPRAKLVKREVDIVELHSSIRVPGLDLGADERDLGFLFSVDQIVLSDDACGDTSSSSPLARSGPISDFSLGLSDGAMPRVESSGFGGVRDHDESPFYTFSSSNPFQRGRKLDKFEYKLRLAVFDMKMVWSPQRRNAVWTLLDAFKEKKFTMKAPSAYYSTASGRSLSITRNGRMQSSSKSENQARKPAEVLADDAAEKVREAEEYLKLSFDKSSQSSQLVSSTVREVLKSIPKYEVRIHNPQVIFGSPETDGWVFLTSEWANMGFIEKCIRKEKQTGKFDQWIESESRVHLENAQIYTRWDELSSFNFLGEWAAQGTRGTVDNKLHRVTQAPVALELMYIRSRSDKTGDIDYDADDEDHGRPSMLYINVPDVNMYSTSPQLRTILNVVQKVLMQREPFSMKVNDQIVSLRYNLQLRGGKVPTFEINERLRRLRNITKQLKYCEETGQEELMKNYMLPIDTDFRETRLRYQAMTKAMMTYLRTEHRDLEDTLYPTLYVSYSFDQSSWVLRETFGRKQPLVHLKLTLEDLVCRHVFYIGKGNSQEFTFGNINVANMMHDGYFRAILQPDPTVFRTYAASNRIEIKASDGSSVAFRWYATQTEKVGGIPVYDLLTINIAPLNASMTNRLFDAIKEFLFLKSHREASEVRGSQHKRKIGEKERADRDPESGGRNRAPLHARSQAQDLDEMQARGQSMMHFKYIYIGELQLTASYKMKESSQKGLLDFFDLAVESPSFMYSSRTWTWRDFFNEVKRDLLYTFARRGASALAKLKLIPGYKGTRKTIKQTADVVGGIFDRIDFSRQQNRDEMLNVDFEDASDYTKEESLVPKNLKLSVGEEMLKLQVYRLLYGKQAESEAALSGDDESLSDGYGGVRWKRSFRPIQE